MVTEVDVKKQAPVVSLSLQGNARTVAKDIEIEQLNADVGMTKLLAELDKVYLKDDKDRAYEAYKNFDTYKNTTETMTEYIMEFDSRYNKAKKHEMSLPEVVLSFKLLENANHTPEQKQLAITAASDLTKKSMKSALTRIFGDGHGGATGGFKSISIKQENAYYIRQNKQEAHGP